MREKLNENPVAQIVIVCVLLLVGGYMLLSQLGGSEASEESGTPASSVSTSTEAEGAETEGAEATEVAGEEPAVAGESAETVSGLSPPTGRSLPKAVETAYSHGSTIVLLVVRNGGIDDRLVERAVDAVRGDPGVSLFVAPANQIARYTPITGPLGVDQAPALIVIRPVALNGGGPAPASVTYGFQRAADVEQAVRDAIYHGPKLSYAPN